MTMVWVRAGVCEKETTITTQKLAEALFELDGA